MRVARIAALALLALPVAAHAITYGQTDGGRHPYVGALVGTFSSGDYVYCSGALIAPTVFLTAAHCDIGRARVEVSFASEFSATATRHAGQFVGSPDYSPQQDDPQDLAVVILDRPVRGITPAKLPAFGQFDRVAHGQRFTAVGYGGQERVIDAGGPTIGYLDVREFSVAEFRAVGPGYLRLSQNAATGDGGTCYGDSGGPNFLGAGSSETTIIAGTTITGDSQCVATNVIQRLDTTASRGFLGRFVVLP